MAINVLVTGAAGVLGAHVVSNLRRSGYKVVTSDRVDGNGIDVAWDISCRDAPPPDCEADVVVHLAAKIGGYQQTMSEAVPLFDVNVMGTLRVVHWCMSRRIRRLILASSAIVYGQWANVPKSEMDPVNPWAAGPYAVSKWCGEQVAQLVTDTGCELVILRLASLYGVEYRSGLIQRMLQQGRQTGYVALQPPLDDGFDLLHVADAARAVQYAIERGHAGLYNIGSGKLTMIHELGQICASQVSARVVIADEPAVRPARIINWLDDRKARSELGHDNLISLDTGVTEIARTLARVAF
jgi:nucleoside-diphosphate-sugar epimerase